MASVHSFHSVHGDTVSPVRTKTDGPMDGSASNKAALNIIQSAKLASEKEHKMSLLQGIKLYPKAIAWSVLISTCIVSK